jgi:hypothetical protein
MKKFYFLLFLLVFVLPTKAVEPCDTLPQPTITEAAKVCGASFCDPKYYVEVIVSSGTVTSSEGVVSDLGSNVWGIQDVPLSSSVDVAVTDANGCVSILPVFRPTCGCQEKQCQH